jgi:hypothetical protein
MLFAASTLAVVALSRETRSLPIVFVQVGDPVKLGFVETLEYLIGGKWLELLKDTAPRLIHGVPIQRARQCLTPMVGLPS